MRLFIINRNGQKVYLYSRLTVKYKNELKNLIGSDTFYLEGEKYHIDQIRAEDASNDTIGGAVIGGVAGMLAGPTGADIGSIIGGAIGNSKDKEDLILINQFNLGYNEQ